MAEEKKTENREYKSDVFSMLMEDPQNALSVYNVLSDNHYDDPSIVHIRTLRNSISLSISNDSAFIISSDISVYEHQSSYNPNMPLRSILYYAELIKPLIANRDLYGRKLIEIPTPHFAVLYNGQEKRPERETLRLSDAFMRKAETAELELVCTVYNINPDNNEKIKNSCKVLTEYCLFVEKVKENIVSLIDNPIAEAISYCIENHILEDFLRERGQEVLKAMTIDMTFERRIELATQDAYDDGMEKGISVFINDNIENGKTKEIIIDKLIKNFDITIEKAKEYFNRFAQI